MGGRCCWETFSSWSLQTVNGLPFTVQLFLYRFSSHIPKAAAPKHLSAAISSHLQETWALWLRERNSPTVSLCPRRGVCSLLDTHSQNDVPPGIFWASALRDRESEKGGQSTGSSDWSRCSVESKEVNWGGSAIWSGCVSEGLPAAVTAALVCQSLFQSAAESLEFTIVWRNWFCVSRAINWQFVEHVAQAWPKDRSFGRYPKLGIINEGWQEGIQQLCLVAQLFLYSNVYRHWLSPYLHTFVVVPAPFQPVLFARPGACLVCALRDNE